MADVLKGIVADPETMPVEIAPRLLLGDASTVDDVTHLRSLGVTHVLNCSNTDFGVRDLYSAAGIAYVQLDAQDEVGYSMRQRVDTRT